MPISPHRVRNHANAIEAIYLNQAAPVLNNWYAVLAEVNIRLLLLMWEVATTGETVEVELTHEGPSSPDTISRAIAAGTPYYLMKGIIFSSDWFYDTNTISDTARVAYVADFDSLAVRIRKTTAAGAGNLRCKAVFQRC